MEAKNGRFVNIFQKNNASFQADFHVIILPAAQHIISMNKTRMTHEYSCLRRNVNVHK